MAAPRKTNWFAIWTVVIVAVIVIGVGWAVLAMNSGGGTGSKTAPVAGQLDADSGVVPVGTGKKTITTYIDFMCPICGQFETNYGDELVDLAAANDITLEYRPVAILDGASSGTKYSTRAANAFYCVADSTPAAVVPFVRALFKNQPQENSTGLDDDKLVALAKDAGADIASCQKKMPWADKIATWTEALPANSDGSRGTPTVMVDGSYLDLNTFWGQRNYFTENFGGN
ncbi:DsbA family protein [Microbacterium gorillae]|uniref:DsbA family protein n=1 Tax=Microbacterium gorillae TaxID=1231063 RepID=UPI00058BBC51|nr:thioredoxin domain-containing protein [Microbacterium gorillae]